MSTHNIGFYGEIIIKSSGNKLQGDWGKEFAFSVDTSFRRAVGRSSSRLEIFLFSLPVLHLQH